MLNFLYKSLQSNWFLAEQLGYITTVIKSLDYLYNSYRIFLPSLHRPHTEHILLYSRYPVVSVSLSVPPPSLSHPSLPCLVYSMNYDLPAVFLFIFFLPSSLCV